jgi:hypothetical protein
VNKACAGGRGGPGGNGGAGGGGAGGVSIAILFTGEQPARDDQTTIATARAGRRGQGGHPGVNDGIDGVAAEIRAVSDH